jgi:phospholipid/cholesterol/gamma-HCH transport system ATP-binding protein
MSTENTQAVTITDVGITFGETPVHEGLSLGVANGEILSVVGASGTGKSLLLQAIVGLIKPQRGSISIFGQNICAMSRRESVGIRRRCGVLFQDGALFSSLTVCENIQTPLHEHYRLPARLSEDIAALKLAMVGLDGAVGDKYPSELSGGMRKRAGLARALALDPELLFLDEPTAGLDPIGAAAFDELILEMQRNLGLTVFMVTHDLDSIYSVSNRVAVLGERRVLVAGTLPEVSSFAHPWVQQYFHGSRASSRRVRTNHHNSSDTNPETSS